MKKRVCVLRFGWLPVVAPPIRNMMDALVGKGFQVSYVKSKPRSRHLEIQLQQGAENHLLGLWLRAIPSVPVLRPLLQPLIFVEFVLRSVARGLRCVPDLVVAVDLDTLLPAWIVAKLRRARLVYYTLELYTDRPYVPLKALWNFLERRLIKKADLVVACEPNRARILQERHGLATTPLTVLNVPPYRSERQRTTRINDYLRQAGIPCTRTAFYQGLIKPARGADYLVEASKQLRPGFVLFLIGPIESSYKQELLSRIGAQGLERRVVLHPMVPPDELSEFARSADLSLVLLLNDGLNNYYCAPTKLYDSLALGVPVVASNFPGLLEVVEGNEVGLCVDPEDPRALAQAINTILADDALRERMSRSAQGVAREKYCYEVEGEKLLAAVDALLSSR